jgi:outer membrane protein OmpA-like peptidoglycan-associated protein
MIASNYAARGSTDDILRNGDDMNDPSPALQRLGAALDSGNRDAVMACFSPDATVDVLTGHKRMAFTGKTLGEAVDTLLAGFDKITLTPNTRQVVGPQLVEEAVLSGSHTGSFAGAEPTQGKVHVNVKLTATAGPDSKLKSLRVDSDTRALFAQIADSGDIIGVGGRLIAGARERHNGVRVIDAPRPPVGHEAPASNVTTPLNPKKSPGRWGGLTRGTKPAEAPSAGSGPQPGAKKSRIKWAALAALPVLLLIVFLTWRNGSSGPSLAAADHPAPSPTSTSRPTTTPTAPKPTPKAKVALPVIATAAPKSVPHVQAGQQLVLRSDVLFGLNSAALTPSAKTAVTTLATQISSSHVTGTIQINGYTDNLGTVDKNLALSQARALAVAEVLQAGLAGQSVTLAPQGFGQASPVAPNTTNPNRARNRRVTIVLPTPR